ncbi:MAG: cyclase family protein [Actinomycetes bacterium]
MTAVQTGVQGHDAVLAAMRVVDLSAPLGPDTVMWPGAPAPAADAVATMDAHGYFARLVHVFEHSGTHFDAPCHMVDATASVDQIAAEALFVPVRCIDISGHVGDDADGALLPEHVVRHEDEHGRVPAGSAVFLRTGWEERNHDKVAYAGQDGDLRFPGYGVDAARVLVEERGVVGLGVDTLGIDPGCATEFPVHKQVSHPRGVWHLENLTNLAALPPAGAWAFVGVPRVVGGSGFPARVIALVP